MMQSTTRRLAGAAPTLAVVLTVAASAVHAQDTTHRQPPRVPTIVALSMTMGGTPFGVPRFFDGVAPTDWPPALVPGGAKVVGGGTLGDSLSFRIRVAVFDLGGIADPAGDVRDLVTKAGFVERPQGAASEGGGFMSTDPATRTPPYCRASTMAMFGVADSVEAPGVVSVHLIDGPAGRQMCEQQRAANPMRHSLIPIPTMSPPRGGGLEPGGTGSNGESGYSRATLRSTMPADSVLAHFTAQLVAGGWLVDGRPAAGDGVGAQRFLVREGDDGWTAALFIMVVAGRHEIRLDYARR